MTLSRTGTTSNVRFFEARSCARFHMFTFVSSLACFKGAGRARCIFRLPPPPCLYTYGKLSRKISRVAHNLRRRAVNTCGAGSDCANPYPPAQQMHNYDNKPTHSGAGYINTVTCRADTKVEKGFTWVIDWRTWMKDHSCSLRPADDQQSCGACWAMSVTHTVCPRPAAWHTRPLHAPRISIAVVPRHT